MHLMPNNFWQMKQLSTSVVASQEVAVLVRYVLACAGSLECLRVTLRGEVVLTPEVSQAMTECAKLTSLVLSAESPVLFTIGDMPQLQSLYVSTDSNLTFTCQAAELGVKLDRMQLQYNSCSGASMPELLQAFSGRGVQHSAMQCSQPDGTKLVTKLAAGCNLSFMMATYCYCKACYSCLAAQGILAGHPN
jgi:hypothetical protein